MFLLALATIGGCDRERQTPSPRLDLQPARSWLEHYYGRTPLVNGWQVTAVTTRERELQIMVAIPEPRAVEIMLRPADEQFRLVGGAVCPGKGEEFWRLLPPGGKTTVLPTRGGEVFIEVDCPP